MAKSKFELKNVVSKISDDAEIQQDVNIATEEMVDKSKEEFDTERKNYEEHNFLVKFDLEAANQLLDFLKTKVSWKFRNAYGIIQCVDVVIKGVQDLIANKVKGLLFKSIELEAIAYFISNYEGIGYDYAQSYIKFVDPLFETMQEATKWRNKLELLRQKYILFEDSFKQQIPVEEVNLKDIAEKEKAIKNAN